MKMIFAALALVVSSSAMAASKYVTVKVCDGGESGRECRTVTYKVRPPSKPQEAPKCEIAHGEAGVTPCPTHFGVPAWLKELNDAFRRAGATARDPQEEIDQYNQAGG